MKALGMIIMGAGVALLAASVKVPEHLAAWSLTCGAVAALVGIVVVLCDVVDDVRHEVRLLRTAVEGAAD